MFPDMEPWEARTTSNHDHDNESDSDLFVKATVYSTCLFPSRNQQSQRAKRRLEIKILHLKRARRN